MENLLANGMVISAGEGLLAWGASKAVRGLIVRAKANSILDNLSFLQMGGGTGNEYTDVVVTTKLLNFVVPALIGIGAGIGAVVSELHGDHNTALGLAAVAVPHLVELATNKRIRKLDI